MSALPPKADSAECDRHVRFVPKADMVQQDRDVRFVPKADIINYSITSSANNKNDSGTVRPSPLAVFKFTTKLNFVGS